LDARLNRATGFIKLRRRNLKKQPSAGATAAQVALEGKVEVTEPITIKGLSAAIGIKGADIIKYLFNKGVMATINTAIDADTAIEIALEYDIELDVKQQETAEQILLRHFEKREEVDVRPRPPVVTVLGHVDHGKTSLLDRIRAADVASQESGGITQHVGAYRVSVEGQDNKVKTVVFLDTPGHEAFTSMRARGAGMTDVVVLVVAADDGVMPQTIESINHAKAANVPIVVALNKIDKPEATQENIHRIFGQLAEHGLTPRDWGGNTDIIKVSATQNLGITELLEVLDYEAALLELKADYGGPARGTVIESQMRPGRGAVARILVQQGLLNLGDFVVMGRAYGRVRDITDDHGHVIDEAGPATPLELSGIDMIPDAGDKFYVTDSLQKAEEIAQHYREVERNRQLASKTKITLDNFADQIATAGVKDLKVVLKADVQGSIDVLRKSLEQLSNKEVAVKVLHAAVGGINESDVILAEASDAVIIGFHVVASSHARELAEQRGVEVRLYKVIYDVINDVTKALEGMLAPEIKEEIHGTAEVRDIFKITKLGVVAGCFVVDGVIQRSGKMRLTRNDVVVTEDRAIESLRRVKDDVREVRAGTECGIRIVGFEDIKPGDKLVCYSTVSVNRKLLDRSS
jgi:translation initiation factor IF-2